MNFPVYTNLFYDLNFTDEISKEGLFKAKNDTIKINLRTNLECLLLLQWYDIENREWLKVQRGEFKRGEDWFSLYVPRKSQFILKLGALTQTDSSFTTYDEIIYYRIINE